MEKGCRTNRAIFWPTSQDAKNDTGVTLVMKRTVNLELNFVARVGMEGERS